ncbi:hypothetical protein LR48_Vigan03g156800 [Vigna angularis]|uniref:Amino acid transporter transmembrane domain-containing protein n=1 Tax=Phaseolus angularis TaxID=3914 RepID=A0A0L9U5Z1_PHAAN|nr:hypothetical protein LR48_Vigan03g156800 [Vigna angularis]
MGTETPTTQKFHSSELEIDNKRTAEQKAIDDWLPITSSRNAKWWYSAFHNVTAMVGAGVLSLPSAMANLGWGPGVVILVLSWIITLYTLWQMVEMHEMVPGKRFDRYHELGQHAFGEKLGLWIVVPQQLICEISVDIVYMVTGGKSLQKIHDLVCKNNCNNMKTTYFIIIFGSVHFVLSHLPNFNAISGISLAAAIMSLSYSTIAWVASVEKHVGNPHKEVEYGYKASTLYAMPVFDMIETVMVKQLRFKPSWWLRFVERNVYVAFTLFVAITFPFFGSLLGFFGGFAFAPTTYFICIILGFLLMILAPIGGLRSIILNAKTYGFYQ